MYWSNYCTFTLSNGSFGNSGGSGCTSSKYSKIATWNEYQLQLNRMYELHVICCSFTLICVKLDSL